MAKASAGTMRTWTLEPNQQRQMARLRLRQRQRQWKPKQRKRLKSKPKIVLQWMERRRPERSSSPRVGGLQVVEQRQCRRWHLQQRLTCSSKLKSKQTQTQRQRRPAAARTATGRRRRLCLCCTPSRSACRPPNSPTRRPTLPSRERPPADPPPVPMGPLHANADTKRKANVLVLYFLTKKIKVFHKELKKKLHTDSGADDSARQREAGRFVSFRLLKRQEKTRGEETNARRVT